MGRNTKGTRRERELVNLIDATDEWAVMRAPASGSATTRELPDLLMGNGDRFYAVEAKSSGGDPIYLDEREIDDLYYFSVKFGATALVAARFDAERGDPWYGNDDDSGWRFFDPRALHRTPSGNYRIKKERALLLSDEFADGKRLDEL